MPATKDATPADPLVTRMAKMKAALEMLDAEIRAGASWSDR
jgi:hypothetical protein